VAPEQRRLKGFSVVAGAFVLSNEQAKHVHFGGRAGALRATGKEGR
jgi:hypothetical protein